MIVSFRFSSWPPLANFLRRCETDSAWFYTLGKGIITAVAGPVILFLVATRLSPIEQGYYFTFAALSGLTTLVDLGVAQTISISASHLSVNLRLGSNHRLAGDPDSLCELAGLLRFYLAWYLVAAVVGGTSLGIAGFSFLSSQSEGLESTWQPAWLLLVIALAAGLPQYPFWLTAYGIGLVERVALWRLGAAFLRAAVLCVALLAGWGLLAQGLGALFLAIWGLSMPLALLPLWVQLLSTRHAPLRDVAARSLKFQWQVGCAWFSGYVAASFLTPLLFHLLDGVAAGQFGATFSLCNAAATLGLAWMVTRTPRLSALVGKGDTRGYAALSRKLILLIGACAALCLLIALGALLVITAIRPGLSGRFLGFPDAALMALSCWCYVEFGVLASLLRCFRSEPLMWEYIGSALLMILLPLLLIPALGVRGAVLGHLAGSFLALMAAGFHFRAYVSRWMNGYLLAGH